uniref:Uncharacterized protein n=1 Tax=Anguilla anguilla TaxID=7936 RepID=A0A0E9PU87_ANGAN
MLYTLTLLSLFILYVLYTIHSHSWIFTEAIKFSTLLKDITAMPHLQIKPTTELQARFPNQYAILLTILHCSVNTNSIGDLRRDPDFAFLK